LIRFETFSFGMKFSLVSASLSCAGAQDLFLSSRQDLTRSDLQRAHTQRQAGRLAGTTPHEIADKLNNHISSVGGAVRSCEDHSLQELNEITKDLLGLSSDKLQEIYSDNKDARGKRFASIAEYEASWAHEVDSETLRHAKCFEIGELWAHHLPEAAKKVAAASLPKLPVYESEKASDKLYAEATSCQTGHGMVAGGDGSSSHEWPDWPEQLHYKAKGHGAYPFWWGGGSDDGEADLEVWWSEKLGAEKFYHSSCTGKGSSKGLKQGKGKGLGSSATSSSWLDGPCVHLMLAPGSANQLEVGDDSSQPRAYLYKADESKCCISEPTSGETLAPSQGNFWNTFTYKGEVDFNGKYYQGKAKYYVMTGVNEPVREFWYFTDLDGKPVQQGEAGTGPTDQGYPTSIGHTIWHDYEQSTFDTSTMDSATFSIPDACKTTTLSCAFP